MTFKSFLFDNVACFCSVLSALSISLTPYWHTHHSCLQPESDQSLRLRSIVGLVPKHYQLVNILNIPPDLVSYFITLYRDKSHKFQGDLELLMQLKMTLNFCCFCFYLLNSRIIETCHHFQLKNVLMKTIIIA